MNRSPHIISLAILLICAHKAETAETSPVTPSPHFKYIAREFSSTFPAQHLKYNKLDDSISKQAWTNYINSLDPDHTYFLASDIKEFEKTKTLLDDLIKEGNLEFAYDVFAVFKQRLQNRYEYIQKLLDKDFDMDIKEMYTIKRSALPFPEDEEAWNDTWRKKVKNSYVRSFVAKALKEAEPEKEDDKETTDKENPHDVEDLNPKELILKRYKNMKTIIDDSDADWVLQKYISSVAHAYDPHSSYFSPSALANFNIDMKLSLEGIGAMLQPEDGAAMIVRLIPGGPASKDESETALKQGDKIIAVGQGDEPPVDILHWPLDKIVKLIRGPKGTVVVLTVIPKSAPTSTKTVRITRDEVKLEDQAAKWQSIKAKDFTGKEHNLGVITLPAFYANMHTRTKSDPKFKSSAYDVETLIRTNIDGMVDGLLLDLRNNGGGSLLEAINMTGLFISSGPVVQVKERFRRVLDDNDPKTVYAGPLVVLVNRLSASASEILASALQDYGRAIIVGDSRTHGKGTVQNVIRLDDKNMLGAIKVTSAGYYRISGDSTQLIGVKPDIILPSIYDNKEWGEENLPNAMTLLPVHRSNYSKLAYLEPVVAKIKEYSEARRSKDPQFEAYSKLLDRLNKMYNTTEMPLDLETRTSIAQEEKKLYDIQEELMKSANGPTATNANLNADIILQEALNILADLTALDDIASQPVPPAAQQQPQTILERISNWLRSM